jgi:hypothetical protein
LNTQYRFDEDFIFLKYHDPEAYQRDLRDYPIIEIYNRYVKHLSSPYTKQCLPRSKPLRLSFLETPSKGTKPSPTYSYRNILNNVEVKNLEITKEAVEQAALNLYNQLVTERHVPKIFKKQFKFALLWKFYSTFYHKPTIELLYHKSFDLTNPQSRKDIRRIIGFYKQIYIRGL